MINVREDPERSGTCQRGDEGGQHRFPFEPFFILTPGSKYVFHFDYPPEAKMKQKKISLGRMMGRRDRARLDGWSLRRNAQRGSLSGALRRPPTCAYRKESQKEPAWELLWGNCTALRGKPARFRQKKHLQQHDFRHINPGELSMDFNYISVISTTESRQVVGRSWGLVGNPWATCGQRVGRVWARCGKFVCLAADTSDGPQNINSDNSRRLKECETAAHRKHGFRRIPTFPKSCMLGRGPGKASMPSWNQPTGSPDSGLLPGIHPQVLRIPDFSQESLRERP